VLKLTVYRHIHCVCIYVFVRQREKEREERERSLLWWDVPVQTKKQYGHWHQSGTGMSTPSQLDDIDVRWI